MTLILLKCLINVSNEHQSTIGLDGFRVLAKPGGVAVVFLLIMGTQDVKQHVPG